MPALAVGPVSSPLVLGLRHPRIVLPESAITPEHSETLCMMLAHELAHLRRDDLWWNWLFVMVELLCFFHPVSWMARSEVRLVTEVACDELAISSAVWSRQAYGALLIEIAVQQPAPELSALGINESQKTLIRRLRALADRSLGAWRLALLCSLIIFLMGVGFIPWQLVRKHIPTVPTAESTVGVALNRNAIIRYNDQIAASLESIAEARQRYFGKAYPAFTSLRLGKPGDILKPAEALPFLGLVGTPIQRASIMGNLIEIRGAANDRDFIKPDFEEQGGDRLVNPHILTLDMLLAAETHQLIKLVSAPPADQPVAAQEYSRALQQEMIQSIGGRYTGLPTASPRITVMQALQAAEEGLGNVTAAKQIEMHYVLYQDDSAAQPISAWIICLNYLPSIPIQPPYNPHLARELDRSAADQDKVSLRTGLAIVNAESGECIHAGERSIGFPLPAADDHAMGSAIR